MGDRLTRSGPWVTLVGVVTLLVGLTADLRQHRLDPIGSSHEAPLAAGNPGHWLFALGLTFVVVGATSFLVGSGWRKPGRSALGRAGSLGAAAGLIALATTTLGSAVAAQRSAPSGHTHVDIRGDPANATPEQRAAADKLVGDTRAGIARFVDFDVAVAEGYYQTTPFFLGWFGHAHYHNRAYSRDGRSLDLDRPEGLVYYKRPNGQMILLGALYLALKGHGPVVAGPLAPWHTHDNLCIDRAGMVVRVAEPSRCPSSATLLGDSIEMLHVWRFEHPDGPFAVHLTREALDAANRQLART